MDLISSHQNLKFVFNNLQPKYWQQDLYQAYKLTGESSNGQALLDGGSGTLFCGSDEIVAGQGIDYLLQWHKRKY